MQEKTLNPLFLAIFIVTLGETLFNREFFAGVLPLGLAGINVDKLIFLRYVFVLGAKFFVALSFLVPATLLICAALVKADKWLRSFFVCSTLSVIFSLALDFQHIGYGLTVNENASPLLSLFLVGSSFIAVCVAAFSLKAPVIIKTATTLFAVAECCGYLFLIGNMLTSYAYVTLGTQLAYYAVKVADYAATFAGFALFFGAIPLIAQKGFLGKTSFGASLIAGLWIEYVVLSNSIAGITTVLGTIIIYVFGFQGVTNAFVPFIFTSAVLCFVSAVFMLTAKENIKYFGLGSLIIIITGLIYDSAQITTYIMLPLVGFLALKLGEKR
jgi:hypothetical protein